MVVSKIDLVNKLIELGYQAEVVEGVPYLYNLPYAKADKIIKKLGYKGSYGVKRKE